jgi:hypothetical protein
VQVTWMLSLLYTQNLILNLYSLRTEHVSLFDESKLVHFLFKIDARIRQSRLHKQDARDEDTMDAHVVVVNGISRSRKPPRRIFISRQTVRNLTRS